ncbi:MAG: glycosyltransferase family 2 protein, partial [Gluconacetobacter diazotrophicus]|nr:glycosyltransferase family 2 protein [Gluconacetobacter diazotrophicus]
MDHPPPHAVPDHAPGHEPGNGDELRDALLAAEHRNSALRRRMERERDRADALERHLASIPPPPPPVDLSEFHRRLDEQQARLDAQRSLLDDQGELIGKQHRLIAAGENAAAAARAELDALTASTAWKLTWPIRRVLAGRPHLARRARRLLRGLWWSATLQLPRRLRERAGRESIAFAEPAAPFAPEFASDAVADIAPGITEPEAQLPFGGSETGTTTAEAAPPAEPPVQLPVLATAARPVVSIVIPCFGQVPVTLRCLRAVAASETRTPFEVIVAEDASGDPAVALLERVEGLRLLRNERNLGFLHNCNAAVARARGRFILLLNNDTEPLPGFLDALVGLLEARPDAGLVGSKLLFPDGRLQEAGGVLWQDGSGWNYGRGEDPALPRYNTVRDTDYISGASIMLRRELWELIGGFDPRYAPAYYEDADLAFQVRARGLRVLFQPSSVVIHHEGLSHGTDPAAGVKANQEVNRHRMVARWPNLLRREHLPPWQHPLLAAEHARGRRMVLVIDHYVPQPDRDAGSRSALAILRALRADGRVVKFWPQNRGHDSYTATLEVMGIEVLDDREPGHFPDWIARHGAMLDQVLVLRPTVAVEFISPLLAHTKARLCFYGLDIYHRRMRRQA